MTVHPTFLRPGLPTTEPIDGKTYREDGWAYIELMGDAAPIEWFNDIEAVAGEGQLVYTYRADVTDTRRIAMFLISPEAQKRVLAFLDQRIQTRGEERTIQ